MQANIQVITDESQINTESWSSFVYNHPHGNAFQTPEMFRVYQETPLYEPILLLAKDNEKMLGVLLAVVQKEYALPFGFLSARSIIWGGPLVVDNDEKIMKLLLQEYDAIARKKAIYSQFRNFWVQNSEKKVFEEFGFQYEQHLNILIDLNKSEKELWKEIASRKRNYINKASREGFTFSIAENDTEINQCYQVLQEVYQRAKLPLPSLHFFLSLRKQSNEKLQFIPFSVKYNDEVIAAFFGLVFKNCIYEYYVGNKSDYAKGNPGDFLLWEIFKWGKQHRCSIFDFGGAGKPGVPYGVRDYKMKFGGNLVELGRYEKIHHPVLMQMAKTGFKLWQKVKFK